MGADIIHSGHLNILKHAQRYGEVIIGLFTDSAIAEYKRLPLISYKQRYDIIKNIRGVKRVVAQDTWDYSKNLNIYCLDLNQHLKCLVEHYFLSN